MAKGRTPILIYFDRTTHLIFPDIANQLAETVNSESILNVVFLPATVTSESLTDDTVIVVDVLRATTTIISALANGAAQVLPQPSIEAAREAYAGMNGDALLGGDVRARS